MARYVEQGVVMDRADYAVADHGSICLLIGISDAALAWFDEHLPEDRTTFGSGVVVEPRYVEDIIAGMAEDGLVGRAA